MANAANKATTTTQARGARAKPLGRGPVHYGQLQGQISVRNMTHGGHLFTIRIQGRLVAQVEGEGPRDLAALAAEHFGAGGVLRRSTGAPGVWLVFK